MHRHYRALEAAVAPVEFVLGVPVQPEKGLAQVRRTHQVGGQRVRVVHQGGAPPGALAVGPQGNGQPRHQGVRVIGHDIKPHVVQPPLVGLQPLLLDLELQEPELRGPGKALAGVKLEVGDIHGAVGGRRRGYADVHYLEGSSMRSQMSANEYTQKSTKGSTSSDVANSQAKLQSARAQLAQAEATLTRVESDSRRTIGLAQAGVASDQDRVQAEMNLKAQEASVQSLKDQVTAAQADLNSAIARTNQATAAQSTVASTRAQVENAVAQLKEAEVRLGYTKIYAPVTGTVLVRAAREGEVVSAGQAIVTVVDFSDTWAFASIPETDADHIGIGDTLRVRLPGGTVVPGKVFYKAAEADFATQRDVGRRKRDIRTIALKVRLENPKGAYVPGMTAEVLVSPEQLKGTGARRSRGSSREAMSAGRSE